MGNASARKAQPAAPRRVGIVLRDGSVANLAGAVIRGMDIAIDADETSTVTGRPIVIAKDEPPCAT